MSAPRRETSGDGVPSPPKRSPQESRADRRPDGSRRPDASRWGTLNAMLVLPRGGGPKADQPIARPQHEYTPGRKRGTQSLSESGRRGERRSHEDAPLAIRARSSERASMTGWWKACRGHRHASAGGRDGVRAARGGRVRRGERHSHERAAFSYARSLWWARRVRLASGGHVVGTGTPSGEDKREWRSNVAEDAQERFRGWGCREQVRFDSATRRPMLISSTLGRAARSITVLPGGGRRRRGKGRARGWDAQSDARSRDGESRR